MHFLLNVSLTMKVPCANKLDKTKHFVRYIRTFQNIHTDNKQTNKTISQFSIVNKQFEVIRKNPYDTFKFVLALIFSFFISLCSLKPNFGASSKYIVHFFIFCNLYSILHTFLTMLHSTHIPIKNLSTFTQFLKSYSSHKRSTICC